MKEKVTVLLDVDGVLAEMGSIVIPHFYELTGIQISKEQINNLPIIDTISSFNTNPNPIEREAVRVKLYERLAAEGTCLSLPVADGAQETVEKLMSDPKVDFRIVTAQLRRSKTWVYERTVWLDKHFGIKANRIYFAKEKHLIHGNIFVDDTPQNVIDWVNYWNYKEFGAVWHTHHNAEFETSGVPRMYNWTELLEKVESKK